MVILVVEGPSAAGKTTWVSQWDPQLMVAEHRGIEPPPGSATETAQFWADLNASRWARALVVEPKILICDEPTSALDVSIQAQVLNLLLRMQERLGLTIILISHDIRVVGHMSHEIGVMNAGVMVEQGPSAELLRRPRHAYSRALFDAAPGGGHLVRGAAEAAAAAIVGQA